MRPGLLELLIVFGIILLLFGGSRVANIGGELGRAISNFRKGMRDGVDETKSTDTPEVATVQSSNSKEKTI
jgi:sec-independent protein translocase protein TatA